MLAFNIKQVRSVPLFRVEGDRIAALVVDRVVDTVETEWGRAGLVPETEIGWLNRNMIHAVPVELALSAETPV